MSAPGDKEKQLATSRALLPNVDSIRIFFELSRDMEQVYIYVFCLLLLYVRVMFMYIHAVSACLLVNRMYVFFRYPLLSFFPTRIAESDWWSVGFCYVSSCCMHASERETGVMSVFVHTCLVTSDELRLRRDR